MREIVERLAAEGRLTTDVDTAARTIWAASNGILTLFMDGTPQVEIKRSAELLLNALTRTGASGVACLAGISRGSRWTT